MSVKNKGENFYDLGFLFGWLFSFWSNFSDGIINSKGERSNPPTLRER